jgi:DNA polymerase-3 subunit beta
MVLKPESITMVATDGHRLAHIEKQGEVFEVSGENRTLIPKKAMSEVYSLLQNADIDFIEFAKDDSTLFFRIGERLLTSRQLTGQFPNFEAVLPRDTSKSVVVRGADLSTAIQRVAQFADERSRAVRMKLDKNELKISSSSTDAGESEDSIEIAYAAEALTIGFNSEYLIDFLKAQSGGEVRLEFKDAQSAGQMRPEDTGDDGFKYRYVVMPMRI